MALNQADARVVKYPHAEMLVWRDDVDCVHRSGLKVLKITVFCFLGPGPRMAPIDSAGILMFFFCSLCECAHDRRNLGRGVETRLALLRALLVVWAGKANRTADVVCGTKVELDMTTLVWTRGAQFPLEGLV
jgi:hypothetical protein